MASFCEPFPIRDKVMSTNEARKDTGEVGWRPWCRPIHSAILQKKVSLASRNFMKTVFKDILMHFKPGPWRFPAGRSGVFVGGGEVLLAQQMRMEPGAAKEMSFKYQLLRSSL